MKGIVIPKDFAAAVKDIKLAILQARAKAAHLANAEALKLYFFVGGYISKKTRNAKWGSGAIDALSNHLQIELPGLRGFSSSSMIFMRLFYEAWASCPEIHHLISDEFHYLASNENDNATIHYLPSNEFVEALMGEEQEIFFVLPLDTKNHPLCTAPLRVTYGLLDQTPVHPREVFKAAIRWGAQSIIVAHNHPSGDPMPGKDDIRLTERLVEASRIIGIPLLDHLILGSPSSADGRGFVSLRKHGVI